MQKQATVVQRRHEPVASSSTIAPGQVRGEIEVDGPLKQAMKRRASGVSAVQQQFFSPFRIRPSLETPTKRVDLNEWYRYYFKHDPYVGTAIELHATYPLCDFELDHEDEALKKEFNEVKENLNLVDFLRRMGTEYWIVGEAFPFGFLDDPSDPSQWERFILLDPDKIKINKHPMAVGKHNRDYFIRLEPDADLKKIVDHGPSHPNTGPLYRNIPSDVIDAVKKGISIPLHPLQASHFKREVNAFNVRGESIISRVLQDLMYLDKLRDAQYAIADRHVTPKEFYMIGEPGDPADEAELADFENILQQTYFSPNTAVIYHHALKVQWEGACLDDKSECLTRAGWKKYTELTYDDQIATFNRDTGEMEYQAPQKIHVYDYDGELLHFKTNNVDTMVTPNHRMFYLPDNERGNEDDLSAWRVSRADEVLRHKRFRTKVSWSGSDDYPDMISINGSMWPIEDFLKVAGWYVSEGSIGYRQCDGKAYVDISQSRTGKHYDEMHACMVKLGFTAVSHDTGAEIVRFRFTDNELANDLTEMFGSKAVQKQVPAMIKDLPPRLLSVFLNAAVQGDGSLHKHGNEYITYWTISKRLADDIQEIALKCGYAPRISPVTPESKKGFGKQMQYAVMWSEKSADNHRNTHGSFPNCNADPEKVPYKGKVWCVTVPNGFFVSRRNGLVTVTGNSGRILPLKPEFDLIEKRLLAGLMMSSAFLHGEGPCLREDHEILTESGWMPIKDVPDGVKLMTYNKRNGLSELQHFKNRIVQNYAGKLIHFEGDGFDCVVTPNHRMLVRRYSNAGYSEWEVVEAGSVSSDDIIPVQRENGSVVEQKVGKIKTTDHDGKVYCYEVPNEFIIVRRNGKRMIVGNTYANATVALDVLIARYMEYRKRLEYWVVNHVYDPICRMNDIYKPTDAELKHRIRVKRKRQPWVPKMQWERGSMRDDQFKTNLIKELVQGGFLPREDLYRIINKRSAQVEQELQKQGEKDKEKQKNGISIPGQPQMAGGGGAGGLPVPPPGGGGAGAGAGAGLPKGGLPPGAPKIPNAPGGGLPMGSPVPNAAGTGPSEGPGGML